VRTALPSGSSDHYDVLVVGSGPGGATIAGRLAETGRRVLLLERGDFLPRERDNWDSQAVFGHGKYNAGETFYDRLDRPFQPELHYYVGGNSKVYGAALFRLLPGDFGAVQHPHGVAPAWPIGYQDLEPHYVRAEHLFWVHGKHGEDPYAGVSSRDYKYPPIKHEPRIQHLSDGLERLGLHPFHLPLGVQLSQDEQGRPTPESPCIRCDRLDGFPCLLGAKADAEWAVIRPALAAYPNLTLMTRTTVERLTTDAGGRRVATVAVRLPDGSRHAFSADIVVLSAGAILSAALLLKSANDEHPNGLANSSDLVGRNYMRHNNLALIAFSREPNPTVFQKTLSLNDFYGPTQHWPYPLGNIQMLGKSDGWQIKSAAPHRLGWAPSAPYDDVARHSIEFWLSTEDLPLADSRVTLRPDGAIKLTLRPDNNTEGLTRLRKIFQQLLSKLGMAEMTFVRSLYLHKAFDAAATAHQAGTARFGTDPASSVLDLDCKAHDLDNLYVVDSSFMPSIGAVNPTLTIIANALRVGDHVADRIGTAHQLQPGPFSSPPPPDRPASQS
jgi:choline dehydrogenase-like flavoprotein